MTPNLNTGDLVLMSGYSPFAKLIKELMGCEWSHLAMAVREGEQLCVWEATGKGVGLVRWKNALPKACDYFTSVMNPKAGKVAVRRLIWPTHNAHERHEAESKLQRHMELHTGVPYEHDRKQLFAVAYPKISAAILGAQQEDLTSVFCWECVSAAYKAMGLLPQERPAHAYRVTEYLVDMPLGLGVRFGQLEYLN